MKYAFINNDPDWQIALYIPNDSLPKHKVVCEVYNQNDDEEESIGSDPSGKMDAVIDQFRHDYPTLAQLAVQTMIKTVGVLGELARGPQIRLPDDPSLTPYPQDQWIPNLRPSGSTWENGRCTYRGFDCKIPYAPDSEFFIYFRVHLDVDSGKVREGLLEELERKDKERGKGI